MPSSLIVVALVVAWLVVLVPMVVRKRQEIAKTADSTLAARVVRSGTEDIEDADDTHDDPHHDETPTEDDDSQETFTMSDEDVEDPPDNHRRYRKGRGGYDPEAAARAARARYGARQRVVVLMILAAVITAIAAALVTPLLWWAHGLIDVTLVAYLTYLRRQVRIEAEIRERRNARLTPRQPESYEEYDHPEEVPIPKSHAHLPVHPTAIAIDIDDEDPWFDELGEPGQQLSYRRAVGE